MLKIFFTSGDLARITVLPAPDPVWELVLSMFRLRGRHLDPALSAWREAALAELRRPDPARAGLPHDLSLPFALLPMRGYFADFLTPSHAVGASLSDALEAIRATPVPLIRRDVDLLAKEPPLPASAAALANGDTAAMTTLIDTMRSYFEVALAPAWHRVESAFHGERTRLGQAVLTDGVAGLLDNLSPLMRWVDGVLHVTYPVDQELRLGGRGLVLVPSYFCWRQPVTLRDPERAPVLVYPVARPHGWTTPDGVERDPRGPLGALLGRNRAAVLAAVGAGCSTSELAGRVGVSIAAASQHATVLRNAGLLTSHRRRHTMMHTLTPLGVAMLHGG